MKKLLFLFIFSVLFITFTNTASAVELGACGETGGGGNWPTWLMCETDTYCGINTAIGCFPVGANNGSAQNEAARYVYLLAIGLGSGVAFLLILYAGMVIMTSSGDPQKLSSGKQLLTAALAGLILIILSVTILRIIGIDILGIPGF